MSKRTWQLEYGPYPVTSEGKVTMYTGYHTREITLNKAGFHENTNTRQAWFPSRFECLNERYGTVADIDFASEKGGVTRFELGPTLKDWKFTVLGDISNENTPIRRRPDRERPHMDAGGIRIYYGLLRADIIAGQPPESYNKINPEDYFICNKVGKRFLEITCKKDLSGSRDNHCAFKFDIFIKSNSGGNVIMKEVDPIIRNDGGGGG